MRRIVYFHDNFLDLKMFRPSRRGNTIPTIPRAYNAARMRTRLGHYFVFLKLQMNNRLNVS